MSRIKTKLYHVGLTLNTIREIDTEDDFPIVNDVNEIECFTPEKHVVCFVKSLSDDESLYVNVSRISDNIDGVYETISPYEAIKLCVYSIKESLTNIKDIRIFEIESDVADSKIKMFKLKWISNA
jgi:hypothetical protein